MGCISSKDHTALGTTSKRGSTAVILQGDKQLAIKARIIDAIKRRDPILFEKTIKEYEAKSLEIIGSAAQQKTLLHHIAEHNFTEGMSLALEYITQYHSDDAFKILNYKDSTGNTPLITCCIHNSVETLEVLLKYDQFIDHGATNILGKTAMEIAIESESPCLNALHNGALISKTNTGSVGGSTYFNPTNTLVVPKISSNKDDDVGSCEKSSRRSSIGLKSVASMAKDKSDLKTTTRLYPILKKLEENNANFVDEEFPHDIFSMVNQGSVAELTEAHDALKWERPVQFLKYDQNGIKVFEAIELNDVSKSSIIGCDLYSALAAMTEFPQRLLKIFTTKEVNKQGAYSVNFLISGIPIEILLDDYFPCSQNSQLLYSKPQHNELWFLLLEKAFAKLYGNYTEIQSVYISEALEMMTGMPSTQQPLQNAKEEDLWSAMTDYDKKNYIVCAGKYQKSQKNRIFSIVGLYEVDQMKIVKLRNHFGDFFWDGNLASGSSKWTKELKEEVGHYHGEKNSFYMEIHEFIKAFDFISVCHYHDNWVRNGLEVMANPGEAIFFEFDVEKEMEVFISVHQKLPRFLVETEDYEISPVEIVLAEEINKNEMKAIAFGEKDSLAGKHTVYATEKTKLKLPEGKYVMKVKVRWVDGMPHEFKLNTFSPFPLQVKKVDKKAYPNFLERVLSSVAQQNNDLFELSNRCCFGSGWAGPYLWLYATNEGDKTWELDIILEKMNNLKIGKKYKKNENSLGMEIAPKEKIVTYMKRPHGGNVELGWKFQQNWK